MKYNLTYLLLIFLILISLNLTFNLFLKTELFSNSLFYVIPWIVLLILLFFQFVRKVNGKFIGKGLFIVVFVALSGILGSIANVAGNITGLNTILVGNYIGTYAGFDKKTEFDNPVEYKYYIFEKGDKRIKSELSKLRREFDGAKTEEFLFWQTAFVKGYSYSKVKGLDNLKDIKKYSVLFFTVGPLYLFEMFVISALNSLPLLLIPIVLLGFNEKFLEKELKPYIDFFLMKKTEI